ncbi:MAG TPA: hypothetical protein VE981_18740 [Planctomycetota bacterium]|nr:hypothetical protein [Planctomycetota bacterium]
MAKAKGFERAEFTEARRRDNRTRWITFVFALLFLAVTYWIARDILYHRLVHGYAQRLYNTLGSASVETIGSVSVDGQGDVTLHDAEAYTHHKGNRRLFFRTSRLRLSLDGIPLRDEKLRVMRVDLFQPEIFVRRESGGEWNVEWAFLQAPRGPQEQPLEEPKDDPWKDYLRPDEGYPRNGVHIHDGIINVTFVGTTGKEVTWRITAVEASLTRVDGRLLVHPLRGDFYGGRLTADIEVPKMSPFTVRQMTVDVHDADVTKMSEGAPFPRPPTGRFDGVLALTFDEKKSGKLPIASGHCEVTEGDLWDVPAFSAIIHLLTLTSVSDRKIDSAVLEFTVEEGQIRVDKMYFMGYPVSLFGDGVCGLTGDWMEIVFVPRLGKSDWNSIIPVIGAPIDLLSNIFKGALMPVVLKGSFDHPEFAVEPFHFLKPSVKQMIEEKSPR